MKQTTTKRNWKPEEKLAIIKSHLLEGTPVSEICEKHSMAPSLFYKWQTTLFENGAQCLERNNKKSAQTRESREVLSLQTELEKTRKHLENKHEVLSELMSEHLRLKKTIGD